MHMGGSGLAHLDEPLHTSNGRVKRESVWLTARLRVAFACVVPRERIEYGCAHGWRRRDRSSIQTMKVRLNLEHFIFCVAADPITSLNTIVDNLTMHVATTTPATLKCRTHEPPGGLVRSSLVVLHVKSPLKTSCLFAHHGNLAQWSLAKMVDSRTAIAVLCI
eukprot:366520-Chlamydomonas_euryale.AAC.3